MHFGAPRQFLTVAKIREFHFSLLSCTDLERRRNGWAAPTIYPQAKQWRRFFKVDERVAVCVAAAAKTRSFSRGAATNSMAPPSLLLLH